VLLRDAEGHPCQRIGANWDITDARRSAADRQDRALALRESEAKSEMLARLSHELRTPLNAILGFTRLLIEDDATQGAAQRGRRLQHIESAGQHLLSLINDVLELSRPEQSSSPVLMAPVSLGELLAHSLPMVEAQAAARSLQWQVEVPPGLAVLADPVRLKQVLLNLLTNAIKYNRESGLIHLSAAAIGGRVLLRVRDTGIGMANDQIREAFEPFQRLRQHAGVEGVGIGLAIVRTLMQRMGGAVRVRSEAGVGSEFELTLAQAEPAAAAIEPDSRQASLLPPPESSGTLPCVLYIEDNPVNMMIIEELVARRGGLRLVGAVDAASGVAAARREHPSLILIDMHLPDAHGHEVLARLRQEPATAGIPCVALSANALAADIETALQLGFSDYWTKPLDFRAFHQALDSLFGPAS
jgi:CheY-like chemotaxis protein